MKHREFALCRVRHARGLEGFASSTRATDHSPPFVRRNIAPMYVGQTVRRPGRAPLAGSVEQQRDPRRAGIGLRALSLVDLAAWDLAARADGQSITAYLGGERRPDAGDGDHRLSADPDPARGRRARSKTYSRPAGAASSSRSPPRPRRRARGCGPHASAMGADCWLGHGLQLGLQVSPRRDRVRTLDRGRRPRLDGGRRPARQRADGRRDPRAWRRVRSRWETSRGVPTTPSRSSPTTQSTSSASTSRPTAASRACARRSRRSRNAAIQFAPHMFAHVHSQVFGALGHDVPIEWGVPGSGVDQFADSLAPAASFATAVMDPLPEEPGFGPLYNAAWIARADRRGRRRPARRALIDERRP